MNNKVLLMFEKLKGLFWSEGDKSEEEGVYLKILISPLQLLNLME